MFAPLQGRMPASARGTPHPANLSVKLRPPGRGGECHFQKKGCPVPPGCGAGQPWFKWVFGLPKWRLALHSTGGDTVDESILCAEENDQLRDDGDEGQCQNTVPVETAVSVHGQLDENGHRVFAGGLDVKQGTHVVVAAPHELEQTAGHQRGTQHRGNDLVQDLDRAAAINGGRLVQVMGDAAHELHQLIDEVLHP